MKAGIEKIEVKEDKTMYKGKKYYFCAVGGKKAFGQNSEKYLTEERSNMVLWE